MHHLVEEKERAKQNNKNKIQLVLVMTHQTIVEFAMAFSMMTKRIQCGYSAVNAKHWFHEECVDGGRNERFMCDDCA